MALENIYEDIPKQSSSESHLKAVQALCDLSTIVSFIKNQDEGFLSKTNQKGVKLETKIDILRGNLSLNLQLRNDGEG